MTVREAFVAAGFVFPPKAQIVCYKTDADGFRWVYGIPDSEGGNWLKFEKHEYPRSYLTGPQIDLSNLPAIDAYDALPEVVRKVVNHE